MYPSVQANAERLPDYEALYDEFDGNIQVHVGGVASEGNVDLSIDQARDFRDQLDAAITEANRRDNNEGTDQ